DASISANSQTVVVFSEITSALTSCLRISFLSAVYVASFLISVFNRIKSAATNSAKSSAAPFSNSTPSSFAIALASVVADSSLSSQQQNRRNGFPLLQPSQQFSRR